MTRLRILFEGGSGDAFSVLTDWTAGRADERTSHVAYSRQFFDICAELDASALVTCSYPGRANVKSGGLSVEFRPDLRTGRSGLGFYKAQLAQAHRIRRDARDFGANLVVVFDDVVPILLEPLRRTGVQIVQSLHCVLWRQLGPVSRARRAVLATSRGFYRRGASAILSASDVISKQVHELAGGSPRPIVEFLPHYRPGHYSGLPAPDVQASPLEVIFVGRVEPNKGVFDLVEIADRLRSTDDSVLFHVCGVGSALEALEARVRERRLESSFTLHGWCDLEKLRQVYARSQLAIVPTRSDFVEGFNQVLVEAVLAGRPAIVSSICPGGRYALPAADIVRADDVEDHTRAIRTLVRDRDELARRTRSCAAAAEPFLCPEYSYASALRDTLGKLAHGLPVVARSIPVSRASDLPMESGPAPEATISS